MIECKYKGTEGRFCQFYFIFFLRKIPFQILKGMLMKEAKIQGVRDKEYNNT